MTRLIILISLLLPVLAQAQDDPVPAPAVPDSIPSCGITQAVQEYPWNGIPQRTAANTAHLREPERPGWEKAALVPYHVLGLPFRLMDYLVTGGIESIIL